jgi:hypothetical protein
MSLINDALRRASQTEKNRPRESSAPGLMQPVRPSRRSGFPWLPGGAVVVLLAAAGWLVHLFFSGRSQPAPVQPVGVVRPAISAPPPKVEPVPPPTPAPAPAPAPTPAVVNLSPPVPSPPVTPAPAPVVVAPLPPFPELKLQGILYNRTNPKIIINGEVRAENESVGDVLVVKILPAKVTVQWNGNIKDLYLESR